MLRTPGHHHMLAETTLYRIFNRVWRALSDSTA
jgi:hypothetical protein